jgi:hypothetical protein
MSHRRRALAADAQPRLLKPWGFAAPVLPYSDVEVIVEGGSTQS